MGAPSGLFAEGHKSLRNEPIAKIRMAREGEGGFCDLISDKWADWTGKKAEKFRFAEETEWRFPESDPPKVEKTDQADCG